MPLSIIILSFNTKKILLDCLKSLYANLQNLDFEVIVVDNASHDGSSQAVKKHFPQVRLIANTQNVGFGAANNQAARLAQGKTLLFLNSDTLIQKNNLSHSIQKALLLPHLGVYAVKLLNYDYSTQPSGGFFPNLFRLFTWQFGLDDVPLLNRLFKSIHPHSWYYSDHPQLEWVTGAFMLIPKNLFLKIGGFDEKIFMYAEELELCYRIHLAGKRLYYDPTNSIVHLGGQSSSHGYPLIEEAKGLRYFLRKHKPAWQLPLIKLIFFCGSLFRLLFFGIILADASKRRAYAQIIQDLKRPA